MHHILGVPAEFYHVMEHLPPPLHHLSLPPPSRVELYVRQPASVPPAGILLLPLLLLGNKRAKKRIFPPPERSATSRFEPATFWPGARHSYH